MKIAEDKKILLTKEKEILNKVRLYFIKQFRKRNINQKKLSAIQVKAYSSIEDINSKIYKDLSDKVTEEEQCNILSKAKNKSALGVSVISYPLIKKAG